jgi:hypothetical protein
MVPPRSSEPHDDGLANLLQPSLTDSASAVSLYSVRANFIVAFFGGPYAAIALSYLNSRRLGRVRADVWVYALLALAWTAVIAWVSASTRGLGQPFGLPGLALLGDAKRDLRMLSRAIGLAVCGLLYLRLRRYYVADQLAGDTSPSPWKAGILVVVGGGLCTVVVAVAAAAVTLTLSHFVRLPLP